MHRKKTVAETTTVFFFCFFLAFGLRQSGFRFLVSGYLVSDHLTSFIHIVFSSSSFSLAMIFFSSREM